MVFESPQVTCDVFTEKEGLLSTVAHDLHLRAERVRVEVRGGVLDVTIDATSIRAVAARRGSEDRPGDLSASDLETVTRNMAKDVLGTAKHPNITFRSRAITPEAGGWRIEGVLSLHGVERPVTLVATRANDRLVAETRIHQPDFGIRPYSAMLGTLKVKPDVVVRVAAPATLLDAVPAA